MRLLERYFFWAPPKFTLDAGGSERLPKADIVDVLYAKLDYSRKETQEIVEAMFEMIKVELGKGESIKLPGFGNFVIRSKRSRVGRNPKTGEEMEITARNVLTFKPSTILRNRVKG